MATWKSCLTQLFFAHELAQPSVHQRTGRIDDRVLVRAQHMGSQPSRAATSAVRQHLPMAYGEAHKRHFHKLNLNVWPHSAAAE